MAGEIGTAYVKVELDPTGIRSGLNRIQGETTGRFSKLGRAAGLALKAGIGAGIAGLGIVAIGMKKSIDAASDLNETINQTRVLFGKNADAILDWSKKSASAMLLPRAEALRGAANFKSMFGALGVAPKSADKMSTSLVQLAADMASFNNEDPTEMLERLRAGMTGEAEPLKRFGSVLTETRVAQFAWKNGLAETGKELTEQQKIQARYGLLLQDTKKQQGDVARTADSWANVQRRLSAQLTDAAAKIGTKLLPIVSRFGSFLSDKLPGAFDALGKALDPVFDRLGEDLPKLLAALEPILKGLGGALGTALPAAFGLITRAASALAPVFQEAASVVRSAITAIAGVLEANREKLTNIFSAIAGLVKAILPILRVVFVQVLPTALNVVIFLLDKVASVVKALTPIVAVYARVWVKVATTILSVAKRIVSAVLGMKGSVIAAWNAVRSGVSSAASAIGRFVGNVVGFFKGLPEKVVSALTSLPGKVGKKFGEIRGKIIDARNRAVSAAIDFGRDLVSGIIDGLAGLADALYRKLRDEITGALGKVASKFGIGSPSKVTRDEIGIPLAQGIAEGFMRSTDLLRRSWASTVGSLATPSIPALAAGTLAPSTAPTLVRVYIGDQELRGIVRYEVGEVDSRTARVLLAGGRGY